MTTAEVPLAGGAPDAFQFAGAHEQQVPFPLVAGSHFRLASDPVAALVEDSVLSHSQVDAALRYRTAHPDEIAARIELHRRETDAAETH